jgi:hypothetical protein
MNINFYVLSIIFAIGTLTINQPAEGESDNFKTYTSNDLQFTIQHPSKWKVEEYPEDNPTEVYFTIRENKDMMNNEYLPESFYDSDFTISVEEPKSDLNTETMTIVNETLTERIQEELNKYTDSKSELIRQNAVTVNGNDGWKIESRYSDTSLNYDRYNSKIIINANRKFYILQYTDVPLKVPETLPLINRMVSLFKSVQRLMIPLMV